MKHSALEKTQKNLIKKSQKFIESSKLKIWSLKADLIHITQQKNKLSETIQITEERFFLLEKQRIEYKIELEYLTESIVAEWNPSFSVNLKPWKIVQDICTGVCRVLGFVECSWEIFVGIAKKSEVFRKYLKVFDPLTVDEETFDFVSGIIKKHGIQGKVKESKVPEEYFGLLNWFKNAWFLIFSSKASQNIIKELEELNKKHSQVYGLYEELKKKIIEINEDLKEGEVLFKNCSYCEKIIKKGKKTNIELISSNLSNYQKKLKRLTTPNKSEELSSPKGLDTLFGQCYSPDPKVLEYKQYYEDSLHELPTQKGENSILDQSEPLPKKSSKKRCCVFSSKLSK